MIYQCYSNFIDPFMVSYVTQKEYPTNFKITEASQRQICMLKGHSLEIEDATKYQGMELQSNLSGCTTVKHGCFASPASFGENFQMYNETLLIMKL